MLNLLIFFSFFENSRHTLFRLIEPLDIKEYLDTGDMLAKLGNKYMHTESMGNAVTRYLVKRFSKCIKRSNPKE